MKQIESLFRNLRRPGVTLPQQAQKVQKEMAEILPKLEAIQQEAEADESALKDLAIETLDHSWSLLQLFVMLLQESESGGELLNSQDLS